MALKKITKNNDLIIQKSDKGSSIFLINKIDYLDKMYNIQSDSKKFVKYSVVDDKYLNFLIGIEKKLTDLLNKLKASETISEINYKKLKTRGSVFAFYMACAKLIKRSLTNVHHLDLFYQQSKLPLTI